MKAERAEQEARMNRSARWKATNNRATTSAHSFWGMVDSAANSRVVSDIITAGDAVRDTLGSGLNKIGKDILRAGSEISEASRALGSGELGLGLSVAGSAAWDLLPYVPLEGVVVKGVEYGVRGVSALTAKVGLFGEKAAVKTETTLFHTVKTAEAGRGTRDVSILRQRVLGNLAESKAARKSSYFKVHTHVEEALTLNVGTELDAATFWSGKGNRMFAENYTLNYGKTTLEMTPGGSYLDSLELFKSFPYEQAIKPWEVLSKRFAQNASGQIVAFVEGASPSSIFNRIEYPVLQVSPSVREIILSPEMEFANRFKR